MAFLGNTVLSSGSKFVVRASSDYTARSRKAEQADIPDNVVFDILFSSLSGVSRMYPDFYEILRCLTYSYKYLLAYMRHSTYPLNIVPKEGGRPVRSPT